MPSRRQKPRSTSLCEKPVFLVAPFGAGVGALYELLAASSPVATLNGAGRDAIQTYFHETFPAAELDALAATPAAVLRLQDLFDTHGVVAGSGHVPPRLLHALGNARRVAFLAAAFPTAQFVYLHRAPMAHAALELGSWERDTQALVQSFAAMAPERWCGVDYSDLIADPADEAYWLGAFLGLTWRHDVVYGAALQRHQAVQKGAPICHAALSDELTALEDRALRLCKKHHAAWSLLSQARHAPTHAPRGRRVASRQVALGLCLGTAAVPVVARAASFVVTSQADDGAGSLRQALRDADTTPDSDVITFDSSVNGTLAITSGQLKFKEPVEIQGPGAALLTLDANHTSRIFYPYSTTGLIDVVISGLTVQNGNAINGGAILAKGANLTLDHVTVQDSNATGNGGAVAVVNSGANNPNVLLHYATVTGNTAAKGGGLYLNQLTNIAIQSSTISGNIASGNGGGMSADETTLLTIAESTLSDNQAAKGGGAYIYSASSLDIGEVTIQNNTSGGGLFLYSVHSTVIHETTIAGNHSNNNGGGLMLNYVPAYVVNSTITGNSSSQAGGGIGLYGRTLDLVSSTVSGNTASGQGGGVYILYNTHGIITNSIVAGNVGSTGSDVSVFSGATLTATFNLIGDANGLNLPSDGNNLTGVDPQLGSLQQNGGSVETLLPGINSPALAAGDPNLLNPPATDARGVVRPTAPLPADLGAVQLARCSSTEVEGASCTCGPCLVNCTCGATATCAGTPAADGTTCDDCNPLTLNDACVSGFCAGTPVGSTTTTGGTTTTTGSGTTSTTGGTTTTTGGGTVSTTSTTSGGTTSTTSGTTSTTTGGATSTTSGATSTTTGGTTSTTTGGATSTTSGTTSTTTGGATSTTSGGTTATTGGATSTTSGGTTSTTGGTTATPSTTGTTGTTSTAGDAVVTSGCNCDSSASAADSVPMLGSILGGIWQRLRRRRAAPALRSGRTA